MTWVHNRFCNPPRIVSSGEDIGFLKMCKLVSRIFRSPGEKILVTWITWIKLKLTSDLANKSNLGTKPPPGLAYFKQAKISLAFAPGS